MNRLDQKVVHVMMFVSVPKVNPDGSFSALSDATEIDIELDKLDELRQAVLAFNVGDKVVNGVRI